MPVIHISNGIIEDITRERNNTFVTVRYRSGRNEMTVRMLVGPRTIIRNMNGRPVSVNALRVGMTINAVVSSAMTRSIPPQSNAFVIEIVRNETRDEFTVGRILDIDRRNRSFTTISNVDPSTIIRFNVPDNAMIFDRMGRPIPFSRLNEGMLVWIRHADFMTASIPPQTTAFEIRVL